MNTTQKKLKVQHIVVDMFREFYSLPWPDSEILAFDPNNFDTDPAPFYEMLSEMFGIESEDTEGSFGGLGGDVEETISTLAKAWDGKTLNMQRKSRKTSNKTLAQASLAHSPGAVAQSQNPIIDCSSMPEAYGKSLCNPGNQLPKRVTGLFEWDKKKQAKALYLSPKPRKEYMNGKAIMRELKDKAVLPAQVLDWLVKTPQEIPGGWRGKCVCFWGSIYTETDGVQFIRCLDCTGYKPQATALEILPGNFEKKDVAAIAAAMSDPAQRRLS